jgi:hypothetical protein
MKTQPATSIAGFKVSVTMGFTSFILTNFLGATSLAR